MEEFVWADLDHEPHRRALLEVLDHYAQEPGISGAPLPESTRSRVVDGLRAHPTSEVLLAFDGERAVGLAVCFVGFSTFHARPLINIHDFAVVKDARGRGLGRRLLAAVEQRARELGCCKLTLEVREDNRVARALYESSGFTHYTPGGTPTPTFFVEKRLTD